MIPISLVDEPIDDTKFSCLDKEELPMLFLGFIIKNEYDNRRLKISDKYNPKKFWHVQKECTGTGWNIMPLYGVKLLPNNTIKQLLSVLETQSRQGEITLATYKNILSQYNLSCDNTYSLFSKSIYPIDFKNLKSVCDDTFNSDKKIFQHMLGLNEKDFDFQTFASLKLLIINR